MISTVTSSVSNTTSSNETKGTVKRIKPKGLNVIPESITSNQALNIAISLLPSNYNFEIQKSVWRIQKEKVKIVAIQFPEGLLMYSLIIADIFRQFCGVEVLLLGDVTYGACCVDDFTAKKLGAEMLIHYGHSCLVPVNITTIVVMYVFVEIYFDSSHLIDCMKNLALIINANHQSNPLSDASEQVLLQSPSSSENHCHKHTSIQYETTISDLNITPKSSILPNQLRKSKKKIALLGTVQFISILHQIADKLTNNPITSTSIENAPSSNTHENNLYDSIIIPQIRPLSSGETLGCTSPLITDKDVDSFVFVADGRFHLEAAMIQNPHLTAYRYDPYTKILSIESYDIHGMKAIRYSSIQAAKNCKKFGLILGTLGRQGSLLKFKTLFDLLKKNNKVLIPFLMAELNPTKLNAIPITQIEVWVQVACPRLSIDWGLGFNRPILTPYELEVAMGTKPWTEIYPMDYYAAENKPNRK